MTPHPRVCVARVAMLEQPLGLSKRVESERA